MKLPRRQFLQFAGAAAAAPSLCRPATALDYPVRPVRVVVPFAAGGSTDIVARLISQWLSERLGKPFVVEPICDAIGDEKSLSKSSTRCTASIFGWRSGRGREIVQALVLQVLPAEAARPPAGWERRLEFCWQGLRPYTSRSMLTRGGKSAVHQFFHFGD
jgi:hypothetical protein